MNFYAAGSPPPSAASVILTVTQQSGIMAGTGITALNSLTGAAQTFGNDTNVTMVSSGTNHAITWAGTLADSRIASASTWNAKQDALVSGTNIKTVNSNSLLGSGDIAISSSLTVGTTPITSGTIGRVLFQGTGNVLQEDASLFWDNTNKRLGVGATPDTSTRLDVRAQGALSTDIAFRVRNSADSANILQVLGNSTVWANGAGGVVGNTTFGQLALDANTTGLGNTAFGYNALTTVTTTSGSTAVGWGSLQLTTGSSNTAVGYTAGQLNAGGTFNTYLGYAAGQYGTTALSSIFIGYAAGQSSNAQYGVFIGQSASTTGGNGTVAIGYLSGGGTGTHNISMGQSSGGGMTTGSGNIHIGYRTVASGVTTGNYNTLIGGNSVVGAVSNNVAISDGQGNKVLWFNSVNALVSDLKIDTTTGIKIGTATTNKLAFWNATPIVQPTTAVAAATFVVGLGTAVTDASTFDGYTLSQIVKALRNTGILA